jgi:uncharacterized protein (TIGR01777 family)
MKIIITGATGVIGRKLCKALISGKNDLFIFSRNKDFSKKIIPYAKEYIEWDYNKIETWENYLVDSSVIIHLAGTNVFGKRWNENYKNQIMLSRVISTRNIVNAIGSLNSKPECFICSSAVGYYGNGLNQILTEESPAGNDFLAEVCRAWEAEAEKVENFGVRRASLRTGIVLSNEGGALKQMILPFKLFIGGPLGNGKQWFPWIHVDDIINAYVFAINNRMVSGAVNAVAPNPVTMKVFADGMGNLLRRPSLFSVPKIALKLLVGEAADTVLASQRVIPKKLLKLDFKFKFETIIAALTDLLTKK